MSTIGASAAPSYMEQRSTWHSPLPYLFGGLAAMLGLIAFALFILACSYWKLSGNFNNRGDGETDLEAGQSDKGDGGVKLAPPVMEEKYLVIMAGHNKPTFLATPVTSRASSFGSNSTCSTSSGGSGTLSTELGFEGKKREIGGQIEMGNVEAHEDAAGRVH